MHVCHCVSLQAYKQCNQCKQWALKSSERGLSSVNSVNCVNCVISSVSLRGDSSSSWSTACMQRCRQPEGHRSEFQLLFAWQRINRGHHLHHHHHKAKAGQWLARPSGQLTSRLRRSARKWEVIIFRDRHTHKHCIIIYVYHHHHQKLSLLNTSPRKSCFVVVIRIWWLKTVPDP